MEDATGVIAAALDQIGARLKQLRARRGVTPTAVSKATGISKSKLSPRIRLRASKVNGRTVLPLTRSPGGARAPKSHEGYEWLFVLSRRMRLILGDHDLVLGAGKAAEFDTRVPHWFGSTGDQPPEVLGMFGPQGERVHARARTTGKKAPME